MAKNNSPQYNRRQQCTNGKRLRSTFTTVIFSPARITHHSSQSSHWNRSQQGQQQKQQKGAIVVSVNSKLQQQSVLGGTQPFTSTISKKKNRGMFTEQSSPKRPGCLLVQVLGLIVLRKKDTLLPSCCRTIPTNTLVVTTATAVEYSSTV